MPLTKTEKRAGCQYQFRGSFGSEDGVGMKIRAFVSWLRMRTFPSACRRVARAPVSTEASRATARSSRVGAIGDIGRYIDKV